MKGKYYIIVGIEKSTGEHYCYDSGHFSKKYFVAFNSFYEKNSILSKRLTEEERKVAHMNWFNNYFFKSLKRMKRNKKYNDRFDFKFYRIGAKSCPYDFDFNKRTFMRRS